MPDLDAILQTAWSSTSAAISVVLVLTYGFIARKKGLINDEGERNIGKLCTTIFLPCLLFSEVGPLASWDNLREYWMIIAYAVFFQLVSWGFGVLGVRLLRLPHWVVPCMVFNNATKAGTIEGLLVEGDTTKKALSRGIVYVLIYSLVANLARFGFGPHMLKDVKAKEEIHAWTHHETPHQHHAPKDEEDEEDAVVDVLTTAEAQPSTSSEATPLLGEGPAPKPRWTKRLKRNVKEIMNPPLAGGLTAAFFGVVPFLHKWFFTDDSLLAPLTMSFHNLGQLYAVLQMFVLGAHLQSKGYARPQYLALVYLFAFRFAIMPLISSSMVAYVRNHTTVLLDPIFDFVMIIAPVGPPALTLAAIVEMAAPGQATITAVATTVVVSYGLAPFVSVGVTLALYVVEGLNYK
ncbi:putative transporter [Vanrija pseudolonga]|uniref:Purtative transporter n=1 Tax=Vanrija pseudolonga TaxID=143232 RepID=A0AAF1BLD0_9TREE|nr:purtative transporter [Vanrija pseudolonga]